MTQMLTVTVFGLDSLINSSAGNPRYRVRTDKGNYNTASDYAFVHGLENGFTREYRENGRSAEITLSRSGTITNLTWL